MREGREGKIDAMDLACEEEDEMYDDEDNEVDGAGISTDEGIVGSGAEIKNKPRNAIEGIQRKWLQLVQDVQALQESSPSGHVPPLWSGLVILRSMLTFNSSAFFTEIVVAMYAHEVSHCSTLMLTTQRMHAGLMILMIL